MLRGDPACRALPRYIRFVDSLPKTATERVQKVKLREEGITADTFDREAMTR